MLRAAAAAQGARCGGRGPHGVVLLRPLGARAGGGAAFRGDRAAIIGSGAGHCGGFACRGARSCAGGASRRQWGSWVVLAPRRAVRGTIGGICTDSTGRDRCRWWMLQQVTTVVGVRAGLRRGRSASGHDRSGSMLLLHSAEPFGKTSSYGATHATRHYGRPSRHRSQRSKAMRASADATAAANLSNSLPHGLRSSVPSPSYRRICERRKYRQRLHPPLIRCCRPRELLLYARCQPLANIGRDRPKVGRLRANIGRSRAELAQPCPTPAKFGRSLPAKSTKVWATSPNYLCVWRRRMNLARTWAMSADDFQQGRAMHDALPPHRPATIQPSLTCALVAMHWHRHSYYIVLRLIVH